MGCLLGDNGNEWIGICLCEFMYLFLRGGGLQYLLDCTRCKIGSLSMQIVVQKIPGSYTVAIRSLGLNNSVQSAAAMVAACILRSSNLFAVQLIPKSLGETSY